MLSAPDIDDETWINVKPNETFFPHSAIFTVTVPEVILRLYFDVFIAGPDCSKLAIANSGDLNFMEVTIGGDDVKQFYPPFRDNAGFIANDFCQDLYLRILLNGEPAPSWLDFSEDEILLEDPVDSRWVGRH